MNVNEFQTGIARLKATFQERNYPDERVKRIWERCKDFPNGTFGEAVMICIDRMRQAPLVEDLVEACRSIGNRNSHGNAFEKSNLHREVYPWHPAVLSVMQLLDQGKTGQGTGFEFGKKYIGLSDDDVWELFGAFKSQDWDCEAARRILAKTSLDHSVMTKIAKMMVEKPQQDRRLPPETDQGDDLGDLFGLGEGAAF